MIKSNSKKTLVLCIVIHLVFKMVSGAKIACKSIIHFFQLIVGNACK